MNGRIKRVAFADERVRESFLELKEGRFEDRQLAGHIEKSIEALKQNPRGGIHIPNQQWPRIYSQKYGVSNLWKYDLSKLWRLIYTIKGNELEVVSVILEWFDHK
ncbi:MAG: hypothetical protein ABIG96_04335, partial [Candidatus Micrarchaeota archaeon]